MNDENGGDGLVVTGENQGVERATGAAVSVRNVYKLFGGDIEAGLAMAQGGASKDEIQEATESVLALSGVSFDAAEGEIFVVMGLSGCGKSTLIRCINRLIEADLGEIWIGDDEVRSIDDAGLLQMRRSKLAMVFQHFGLMPHRSVIDNVSWGLELSGVGRRARLERASEALEAVGLGGWERNTPDELSGGMKQRVGLARAFVMDAPVMLMDEPFSALDPVIRRDLQEELLQTQASMHKTIIFITHDLSEAANIGDRIAIMRDGAIIQSGTPTDVVLHPKNAFVRDFTKDVRQSFVDDCRFGDEQAHPCRACGERRYRSSGKTDRGRFRVRAGRRSRWTIHRDCPIAAHQHCCPQRCRQDRRCDLDS